MRQFKPDLTQREKLQIYGFNHTDFWLQPPCHPKRTSIVTHNPLNIWRRGSESNRRGRLCRPLPFYNIQTVTDLSTPITTPTLPALHCFFIAIENRYRFLYHFLMKTTLNLNDDLVAQAKAVATKERISLTKMIEEGLVLRLRRRRSRSARKLADLPVSSKRGGLRSGIDATSNQSLFDAADA
jgi:Family of unknown function (DUF6364)